MQRLWYKKLKQQLEIFHQCNRLPLSIVYWCLTDLFFERPLCTKRKKNQIANESNHDIYCGATGPDKI